jgi:acetyl esterase/lipase
MSFSRIVSVFLAPALPLLLSELASAQVGGDRSVSAEQRIANWLRMDTDGDEKISPGEAQGLMKTNFGRVDSDGDGMIDRKELEALAKRLRSWGARRQAPGRRRVGGQLRTMTTDELLKRAPEGVKIVPDIAYREGDSEAWRLDLVMPESSGAQLRPGLVFVHGGAWRSGDKRAGTFLNGALKYAQRGYVCITVNYRLTGEAPFPACVEDVKCAVRWLRAQAEQYNVDQQRIGGYGNSAGAHLVAMLGLAGPEVGLEGDGPHQDQSSLLQAVCCSATPSDFLGRGEAAWERMGREGSLLAGPRENIKERAKLASPVTHASADAPPFLVIHGTADTTVNVDQGDRLVEALKEAGAEDVTYLRIEGAGHGVFNSHANQTQPAMEAFFDRTIGMKKS